MTRFAKGTDQWLRMFELLEIIVNLNILGTLILNHITQAVIIQLESET